MNLNNNSNANFLINEEKFATIVQPANRVPQDVQIDNLLRAYRDSGFPGVLEVLVLMTIALVYNSLMITISKFRIDKTAMTDIISFITKDDIKFTEQIEDILNQLLVLVNCDRVVIGIFHNGSSLGHLHNSYVSIEYEVTADGISSIKEEVKKIPIRKIQTEISNGLETSNKFIKYNRKDNNLPQKCIQHLDNINVEEIWSRLLITENKEAYAILQFQWVKSPIYNIETDYIRLEQTYRIFNSLNSKLFKKLIKKK